jgi:hypothetical protein
MTGLEPTYMMLLSGIDEPRFHVPCICFAPRIVQSIYQSFVKGGSHSNLVAQFYNFPEGFILTCP